MALMGCISCWRQKEHKGPIVKNGKVLVRVALAFLSHNISLQIPSMPDHSYQQNLYVHQRTLQSSNLRIDPGRLLSSAHHKPSSVTEGAP